MDKVPAHTPKLEVPDCDNCAEQAKVASPVSSLPEEILEKIFSHLDTVKDLHAVSNASDQLNRILAPSKPIWAFESVFPKILPKLDNQDILNCRLVCKKWCQAVDQDLQSRPLKRPFSTDTSSQEAEHVNMPLYAPKFQPSLICKGFLELLFFTSDDIRKFLEKMGRHPRNPLILRSVYLQNTRASEDYWELALSFLERFGNEIWNICITSSEEEVEPEDPAFMLCSYEVIVRILGHLPNLKTLRVCGIFDEYVNSPLPSLPRLEMLELLGDEDDSGNNQQIFDELLKTYSSQLQLIPLCGLSFWKRHRLHLSNLPQIKHIEVILDSARQTWSYFCHAFVAANLVKLSLIVGQNWSISKLLQPLSKHFPSLQYLCLRFNCRPKKFESRAPPKFLLENVKTLEIIDNIAGAPYDQVFQHLPNLEYLLVCHYQAAHRPNVSFDDPAQWNLFKWVKGTSIENSDIWTKLTFLKELTLARLGDNDTNGSIENEIRARKTFTREMYTGMQFKTC